MGFWKTINGRPVFIETSSERTSAKHHTIDKNKKKDYNYYRKREKQLPPKEYGYVAHQINSNCNRWASSINQQVLFFQDNYYRYTFYYESFDKFVILKKEEEIEYD